MKIKRSGKVIAIISLLMFIVYALMAVFTIEQEFHHIETTYDSELYTVSNIISTDPVVIEKLINRDLSLDDDMDGYYEDVPQLSLIVIMDLNGKRYAHLDDELVGEVYAGSDAAQVWLGNTYIITADSSIGETRKAYVPIWNGDVQVGVAVVEVLTSEIQAEKMQTALVLTAGFGVGLALSVLGLMYLSRRFHLELLGYEPSEIALLYAENKSVIDQLDEALISIDKDYTVTTVNSKLQSMFRIKANCVGRHVSEVFPYIDFRPHIEENEHIINKYKKINDLKLLMNAFPLYLDDKIIGATAIFRSHLEVDALVDQVKGYQQIAEALRSQKHEFQNKLHVVLGLIKMKDYSKAESYIMEHVYTTNLASDYYTSRLKDDKILALFVGKEIQSKEYNCSVLLTSDSYIGNNHQPINSDDIVLVLGNLIDNSFEAYQESEMDTKRVVVDIFEDENMVSLTVIDQAGGINPDVIDRMFDRGISTKNGDSRGTGLSLVNEIVALYGGEKHIQSDVDETKIEIILRKVIV
jgi:sensor histidine kinase regulating citrate/malate metabolism